MKIKRINKEVCGVDMEYGKTYNIVCKDDGAYIGKYQGYNQNEDAIIILPGMIPVIVDVSYIKFVEGK